MKDAGLTPEVANDFLKAIYDKGLTKDFKAIVEDYNQLYNSYFNITTGSIILGDPINPKYTVYLNEIKMVAVGTLAEDKVRVTFTTEVSFNAFKLLITLILVFYKRFWWMESRHWRKCH